MDGSKSLDDLLAELAEVQERLLELPADAFEERVELRERRDDLQAEAGRFAHDWDRDRPTEDLLAELEALRARLGQLDSRRMNVAAQQGGGTQAGGGGDGWGAVQLNLAVDAASGVGEVHARIGRIKAVLADRGVSDVPAVPVVDSKVVWRRVWRLLRLVGMVLLLGAGVWWFFVRPAPVIFPESATDITWSHVTDPALSGAEVRSVTGFGSGLVAVGVNVFAAEPTAAVWTSPDGNAWTLHDAAFGEGHVLPLSVIGYGSDLIAVGPDASGHSQVWSSSDGDTWDPVEYHEAPYPGDTRRYMVSAASFGSGLVVGGAEQLDWPNGDLDAALWYSPDVWTMLHRVPRNEAVFGEDGDQGIYSVTSFSGGVVAVGYDKNETGEDAAVWYSPDGTTWTRVRDRAVLGGAGDQIMTAVTSYGTGVVAVGSDKNEAGRDAAVWYSPDGTTWMRAPRDQSDLGDNANSTMLAVTPYGTRLIAGGTSGNGTSPPTASMWVGTNASR